MAIRVRPADFDADLVAIRQIRFTVFVDEQAVPASLEIDDRDAHCAHFLAFDDDKAVGTARIDCGQDGKIGRLAVLADGRRLGVGRALMQACHDLALARGLGQVWCNAQIGAVAFYERLGYTVTGEPFEEAGIEHRRMTRSLSRVW
jgi:predicted GNAT family N-acyltransferase